MKITFKDVQLIKNNLEILQDYVSQEKVTWANVGQNCEAKLYDFINNINASLPRAVAGDVICITITCSFHKDPNNVSQANISG